MKTKNTTVNIVKLGIFKLKLAKMEFFSTQFARSFRLFTGTKAHANFTILIV